MTRGNWGASAGSEGSAQAVQDHLLGHVNVEKALLVVPMTGEAKVLKDDRRVGEQGQPCRTRTVVTNLLAMQAAGLHDYGFGTHARRVGFHSEHLRPGAALVTSNNAHYHTISRRE